MTYMYNYIKILDHAYHEQLILPGHTICFSWRQPCIEWAVCLIHPHKYYITLHSKTAIYDLCDFVQ